MQLTDENRDKLSKLKEGGQELANISKTAERKPFRADGYVNMLNKYGSAQDNSTAYGYMAETLIPDETLTTHYESNGLFAKIIDIPAQEAVKKGFHLNIEDENIEEYIQKRVKKIGWSVNAEQALKWSRLYGGAIGVMILNDGCSDLSMPVNWKKVKGIEEIVIYDRSCVTPDYHSLYNDYGGAVSNHSKFRQPEFYNVFSVYGSFRVHESRCLIFKNGVMPEKASSMEYRFWGAPEYARIKRELREAITAHGYSIRLLERCVQAVYKMQNLSQLLGTDEGEDQVLRRLQVIDMARSILNSIAIDSTGEDYDFRSISLTGVKEVIESACNMLSAVTEIPQTKLFGRSPAGMNSTGESDLENYYNFIDKIREMQLKDNLCTLVDIIIQIGMNKGELTGKPEYELEFDPLWNESESEKANVEQVKAATDQVKAQTAQIYMDMGVLDPAEIRKGLKEEGKYNIEDEALPEQPNPLAEILGQQPKVPTQTQQDSRTDSQDDMLSATGVGVIVIKDGQVLVGNRSDNGEICGPGGHVESWEDAAEAARRETREEFGIEPNNLVPVGLLDMGGDYGRSYIFLSTEFSGEPFTDTQEMTNCRFTGLYGLNSDELYPPFKLSLELIAKELGIPSIFDEKSKNLQKLHDKGFTSASDGDIINNIETDGGPGSGKKPEGGHRLSRKDMEKFKKRFIGFKTSDGHTIKSVSNHAFDRVGGRLLPNGRVERMLTEGKIRPGHTPNTQCYDVGGSRLVLDTSNGKIVTIMWRHGK